MQQKSDRQTGLGWALGLPRIGAIVGTLLGCLFAALRWNLQTVFLAAALASALQSQPS
jgi:hypothetical protein